MARRKLSAEVTPQEMLRLRAEPYCLSNKEIAQRLDCSYVTVLKYIGKQTEPKKTEPPKQKGTWNGFDKATTFTALYAGNREYLCNFTRKTGSASYMPGVDLTPETIDSIINELTHIKSLYARAAERKAI